MSRYVLEEDDAASSRSSEDDELLLVNDDDDDDEVVCKRRLMKNREEENDEMVDRAVESMRLLQTVPPSKWTRVEVRPRLVTASSYTSLTASRVLVTSTTHTTATKKSESTSSGLVKRVLSAQDVEIVMNDDQLVDFRRLIMAVFERRNKVVLIVLIFVQSKLHLL